VKAAGIAEFDPVRRLDTLTQALQYGAFDVNNYPLVGVLIGDQRLDARHAVADCANWTIYNANTLMAWASAKTVDLNAMSESTWQRFISLSDELSGKLCKRIGGNHFMFLGKKGAAATADRIDQLLQEARAIKQDATRLLSRP